MSVGERVLRVCEVVGARTGTEESAQLGMSRYPLVSPPLANSHASAAAATELSSQHSTASLQARCTRSKGKKIVCQKYLTSPMSRLTKLTKVAFFKKQLGVGGKNQSGSR